MCSAQADMQRHHSSGCKKIYLNIKILEPGVANATSGFLLTKGLNMKGQFDFFDSS